MNTAHGSICSGMVRGELVSRLYAYVGGACVQRHILDRESAGEGRGLHWLYECKAHDAVGRKLPNATISFEHRAITSNDRITCALQNKIWLVRGYAAH